MKKLLFCLMVLGLFSSAQAQDSQPTTAPASAPTSNPTTSTRWKLPVLTMPPLLLQESASALSPEERPEEVNELRAKLIYSSKITGIVGVVPLALSWLIGATMNPQFTDFDDPEAPPEPLGAIITGGISGGAGKALLSASFTTLAFARYQHTRKVRTLYAATGVAAARSFYLFTLALGYAFSNFDTEVRFHPAVMYTFSNSIGLFSSFAVDVIFLVGSVQQSVKLRRASHQNAAH